MRNALFIDIFTQIIPSKFDDYPDMFLQLRIQKKTAKRQQFSHVHAADFNFYAYVGTLSYLQLTK